MRKVLIGAAVLLLGLFSAPSAQSAAFPDAYGLTPAAPNLSTAGIGDVVDLVSIPGSADEAIVVRQHDDSIWKVSYTNAFAPTLYGNLSAYVVGSDYEQGLLSAAFSPNFAVDGRIYVWYTNGTTSEVLSRFQVVTGLMVTAPAPAAETRILEVPDFASNHNGGKVLFGDDGYLYVSVGDGGGANDPQETGQDINNLLGKILRINVTGVDAPQLYTIPGDNPFAAAPGRDEIYAYGLRNPWRMGTDSATTAIWVADVGQGAWEEVEPVVNGANYGWDCYEGFEEFEPDGCPASGFTFPRAVYDHGLGCAVVGGYVYRGSAMPELNGWFVYGDNCSGRIWAVDTMPGATSPPVQLIDSPYDISSFAERPDGELLMVSFDDVYLINNDGDGDGVPAHLDNCPSVANASQGDANGNLHGDACEAAGTGNVNCDPAINSVDALTVLRHAAGLPVVQNEPCLNVGQMLPSGQLMGNVNCSAVPNQINSVDALFILRVAANLSVTLPPGCPVIKP